MRRRVPRPRGASLSAVQALLRGFRVARGEPGHVDARRAEARPSGQGRVVHLRPEALGRVAGAYEHPARAREALDRERLEARVRLDRVLQRAAVDLHRVRDGVTERAGEDRRAHHEVVGERDVHARPRDDLAHRLRRWRPRSGRPPPRSAR